MVATDGRARARRLVPWLVWAASAVLSSLALGVALANLDSPEVRRAFYAQDLGVALVFPAMGALILSRHPRHRVGWLFLATASLGVTGFAGAYALHALVVAPGAFPGAQWAAWVASWAWTPFLALPTLLLLLFPDGRAPSARWVPLVRLTMVWLVVLTVLAALLPGPLSDYPMVDNPVGVSVLAPLVPLAEPLVGVGLYVLAPLCLASLVVRWRRAEGDERAQLKWFVAGAVAALVAVPLGEPLSVIGADIVWLVGLVCLPVAAAVAITKYRLYEIDLFLNRALVYAALTVGGVATYAVVVSLLGAALDGMGPPLVATGVIAVAFAPVRERVQRGVDRLLYGHRSDPYAALARLSRSLESSLPVDAVLPVVAETVATMLKLPYVCFVVDEGRSVVAHGQLRGEPLRLPMSYRGEPVGSMLVGPRAPGTLFGPAERQLLDDVARQAGATVHAVQLTDDLRRSRQALVTSREEERRRLRRDLHDGLGPTLAGLTLQVDAARRLVVDEPDEAVATLGSLKAALQDTVAEIRRLVYELRPPALDELGLVGALRRHVATTSDSGGHPVVTISVPDPLPPLPAAVEVAAYRIVTEALLNAVRHAEARNCQITVTSNELLEVEVSDDGKGLPTDVRVGVGLRSMRERAAELGGACTVVRGATRGTVVRARIPVAWA
ncbi:hypothetical protein BH20ACT8_BH20ACT8_07300 [soil metagenome]